MKDGTKRWSDSWYFYISTNNTPLNRPISFHIYNGFVEASKEQVYYSCQNWNNKLNFNTEIVNTYPYSMGTDKVDHNTNDGINIVSKAELDDRILMTTYKRWSYDANTKYKLAEADIIVNSSEKWRNTNVSGTYNFYNTIMHEIGHVVGLSDKYDSWATEWTMYGHSNEAESKKITLEAQDISNAKSLFN